MDFIADDVLTNPGFRAEYMSGKPVEGGRYHVLIEGAPGHLKTIMRTSNRQRAVDTTNFWDERCNSYLVDVTAIEWHEQHRLARLTPAERIAALPEPERLAMWAEKIGAVA